ncbi:NfeD family protein [Leptospira selangorensis]|uniref:NfeD family protein n=2 Tax=Leptospira selangorensis TaxID=2484982 RepID=A0A5F2C2Q0_9LEPT|nr:NfeD family protein [Leptospira selangorensis]TGM21006.1 NfeD family protein [Leptospira selangorensis]
MFLKIEFFPFLLPKTMDFLQDGHNLSYLWIASGIVLMVAELFVPGGFVFFLGLSATIVGSISYFYESGFWTQAIIWAGLSGILIWIGGSFLRKFFPSSSETAALNPEEGPGRIVLVSKDILVERKGGRVVFQGTEWDAISKSKRIPSGKRARILERENLTFVVEPIELPEI